MRNTTISTIAALVAIATPAVSQEFSDDQGVTVLDIFEAIVDPGKPVDVDGDGLLDVVCGQAVGLLQGTAVLRGQANGTLANPVESIFFDISPLVRLGDFDGDGRTDLWTIASVPRALKVRHGQPDGTFEDAPVSLPLPLDVSDVIVCDIDGDGDDDAIWAEETGSRIHIVESIGGALVEIDQLIVPPSPKDLGFGDVTGNGFDDIVVSSFAAVSVLEGSATGFGAPQLLPALVPPLNGVQLADVRGDATLDIVLSEGGSLPAATIDRLWIYEGGAGLFVTSADVLFNIPAIRQWLIADVNSDGRNDIIRASLNLTTELQNADGTFTTSSRALRGSSFSFADITRDGDPDLVVLGIENVRVREGHEQGVFEGSLAFPNIFEKLLVGDMNDDGLEDVIAVLNNEIDIHFAAPSGGFTTRPSAAAIPNLTAAKLTDGDLDGDLDILAVVPNELQLYTNNGDGTSFTISTQFIVSPSRASLGDFTGDGIIDAFVVSAITQHVVLYEGMGGGGFIETNFGDLGFAPDFETVADVDGDGVDDVIYIDNARTTAVTLDGFVDLGNGGSTALRGFAFADLENDGELEMLLAKPFGATGALGFQVRRPNASGQFVGDFFVETGLTSVAFRIADLDRDGDDDVVLIDDPTSVITSRRLSAWVDDGFGGLTRTSELVTPGFGDLVIDDLDGDGLVDALVGGFSSARVLSNVLNPWTELGQSLAGSAGLSGLDGRGALASDGEIELVVTSVAANASGSLILGFSEIAAPFKGGVLVPNPDVILTGFITDASGTAALPATMPPGVPSGVELFVQAWFAEGTGDFAATSALRGVTY